MEANPPLTLTNLRAVRTADGTPTLIEGHEGMHALDGALSETLHVYGPAIDLVFDGGWAPRFLVVGLGLGYIELLILARAFRRGISPEIFSFESKEELVAGVKASTQHKSGSIFAEVRDEIERSTGVTGLTSIAREALESGRWIMNGPLEFSTELPKVSSILFDPYSRGQCPDLWEEQFLSRMLNDAASPRSVFATYASFGALKRVLAGAGFALETRSGFGRKRECTLAVRLD
ncbi:MAG: MnmC family methyltransferase [Bdellovibrionia bacterium]